jgi:hypothetical protein
MWRILAMASSPLLALLGARIITAAMTVACGR